MLSLLLTFLSFASISLASPVPRAAPPTFVFDGDAPFSVDVNTLAAALTCPNGNPSKASPPVLLVHGTFSSGEDSWGDGYVPALRADGYTACYVTLPNRAVEDMQLSAEYVAYNLHYISYLSGGEKTAVISHSQGGPDTQWALSFWPSTRQTTRAFVALAPDFAGIEILNNLTCTAIDCWASVWQQLDGSKFLGALRARNFKALVPTTTIWSQFDEVVIPAQQNAQLPSATVIKVQDLCPLRLVEHVFLVIDSAAYAIALDALRNGGKASVSRLRPSSLTTCLRITGPNMDAALASQLQQITNSAINGALLGQPRTPQEPPLKPYATA